MTPPTTEVFDYRAWQFWLNVIIAIGVLLNTVYTWWSNRSKVNSTRFNDLEKRITKVESNKGCDQHAEFDKRQREVETKVNLILGRMEGVGNSLDIIQQHLMTEKGNR